RSWSRADMARLGLSERLEQCSVSWNTRRGTLRGLHWQDPPHAEEKIVRCTRGAIFDVIVDLRRDSPTFGRWCGAELTADNRVSLYIPTGCAHGFQTLEDGCEVFYLVSAPYAPASARGIRWDDPALGIAWPLRPTAISPHDAALPRLADHPGTLPRGRES